MADMDVLQALAVLVARRDEVVALIARLDDAARLAGELGMAAAAEEVAGGGGGARSCRLSLAHPDLRDRRHREGAGFGGAGTGGGVARR